MIKSEFIVGYEALCTIFGTPHPKNEELRDSHRERYWKAFQHLSVTKWNDAVKTCIHEHEGRFPQPATINRYLEQADSSIPSSGTVFSFHEPEDSEEIENLKRIDNLIRRLPAAEKQKLLEIAKARATKKIEKLCGEDDTVENINGMTKISKAYLFTLQPIVRCAIMAEARQAYIDEEYREETPRESLGYGR